MIGELAPGSVFAGRLRVERKLGEGGMGVVYEVTQLSTGHRAALKLLGAEGCFDEEVRKRFLLEARQTPSDASEHVVRVIDADVTEGRPWILMELLDGVTLRELVAMRGKLSPSSVLDVMEQLCHGLGGAHARGIVHRDLKPENVFVCASKRSGGGVLVKLLDFGISKALRAPLSSTSASLVLGTEGWWAPEQTLAGPISSATDVWAVGLLAYWMLTGVEFFAGASSSMVAPPASVRAREQGRDGLIPPGFDGWFACCVALEPSARFADAGLAWNALRRSLTAPPLPATHAFETFAPTQFIAAPPPQVTPYLAPTQSAPIPLVQRREAPTRATTPPKRSRVKTVLGVVTAFGVASVAVVYALGGLGVLARITQSLHPSGADAEAIAFARGWDEARRGVRGVALYYAPFVRFRGGGNEHVRPEQAERYWGDFASFPATLSFDWSNAQVSHEPLDPSRPVHASCAVSPHDSPEVIRIEVPSTEDNSHSQTGCPHIEVPYLLRLIRTGGRLAVCHESHKQESLCAVCRSAPGC